jgi:hypothetical protein
LETTAGFNGDAYGRFFELGALNIVTDEIGPTSKMSFGMTSKCIRAALKTRELLRMRFQGRTFDHLIYNLQTSRPVQFDYYCQSYRYFSLIEGLLRQELEFKSVPVGLDPVITSHISDSNSVCLHARRLHGRLADGSSAQSVTEFYGTCDIGYYQRSIRDLTSLHGPLQIFIFSDDISWAQKNLGALNVGKGSVRVVDEADSMRSFYLMRRCRHFIIANSTFSWWAAWLGEDANKTVCVPPVWNRGERRFPSDLFPKDWRIIRAG